MVFPIYNIHIDKGRKTREANRGRTRVANKTPEENRGWWWVQRRRERAERAARARASDSSGTKRVLKEYSSVGSADFRHRDARYVARLSSPHAYIML